MTAQLTDQPDYSLLPLKYLMGSDLDCQIFKALWNNIDLILPTQEMVSEVVRSFSPW